MRQLSEAFQGLDYECKREVLGPWPSLLLVVSADSFSHRIDTKSFRSHDVKKRLDSRVMEYGQKAIIKFLTNESVDAHEIHMRLSAPFAEQTDALPIIQFPVSEIQRGREDLLDKHRSGRPALDYIDTKITSIFEKVSIKSVPSISQVPNVDHATMLHCLHKKLGFKTCCL
jgi:hypothetical protein